jgi:hypothetical protein
MIAPPKFGLSGFLRSYRYLTKSEKGSKNEKSQEKRHFCENVKDIGNIDIAGKV